jgi:hypothetical protein
MNAEVSIFVDQREDALQVPVQALYETKGHFFCLLQQGLGWETREVKVGSSNDSFMVIEEGLEEGELVVLNPRAHGDKLTIPDLPDPEPPEAAEHVRSSDRPPTDAPRGPAARKPDAGPRKGNAEVPGGGGFNPARMFTMMDQDGDGTISQAEVENVPAEGRDRLLAADADGDGQVTREEFNAAVAKRGAGGGGGPAGRGGGP